MTKTWLITGCSTGFGRLLAQAALDRGDQVVATARDPATLSDMAKAYPKTARTTALDVTKAGAPEKAVALAMDAFGRLDVLVNNAGFGFIGAIEEATPDEYRPMFETNIIGLLETTRAALPALRKTGAGGRIVNISSARGSRACKARGTTMRPSLRSKAFRRRWLLKSPHSASRSSSWSRVRSEPTSSAARSRPPRRRCRNMREPPACSAPSEPTTTASRWATRSKAVKVMLKVDRFGKAAAPLAARRARLRFGAHEDRGVHAGPRRLGSCGESDRLRVSSPADLKA